MEIYLRISEKYPRIVGKAHGIGNHPERVQEKVKREKNRDLKLLKLMKNNMVMKLQWMMYFSGFLDLDSENG